MYNGQSLTSFPPVQLYNCATVQHMLDIILTIHPTPPPHNHTITTLDRKNVKTNPQLNSKKNVNAENINNKPSENSTNTPPLPQLLLLPKNQNLLHHHHPLPIPKKIPNSNPYSPIEHKDSLLN